MHEIKFRGKQKDNGKWLHGYYIKDKAGKSFIAINEPVVGMFEVDSQTIGVYIGMKDWTSWDDLSDTEREAWVKSGKSKDEWEGREIYTGDVIEFNDNGHARTVGNIYDNPEFRELLMEGEEV